MQTIRFDYNLNFLNFKNGKSNKFSLEKIHFGLVYRIYFKVIFIINISKDKIWLMMEMQNVMIKESLLKKIILLISNWILLMLPFYQRLGEICFLFTLARNESKNI
ncbi:hypothetical protein BpHYR1_004485 [Brachionus plicatilis]|uniref:Transmembrane protein n=1 Tax=Brachionus plicatilis TaxID=10195 RepID=A0A3M7SA14_BRAPC|nr:hypothetical protein BpHYR1_004485 [Brachionus plicatilis]